MRFKVSRRGGTVMNAVPEFEDCAKLALTNNLPVKEVQAIAATAYRAGRPEPSAAGAGRSAPGGEPS